MILVIDYNFIQGIFLEDHLILFSVKAWTTQDLILCDKIELPWTLRHTHYFCLLEPLVFFSCESFVGNIITIATCNLWISVIFSFRLFENCSSDYFCWKDLFKESSGWSPLKFKLKYFYVEPFWFFLFTSILVWSDCS